MSDDESTAPTTEYLMVRLKRATGRVSRATGRFQQYVDEAVARGASCEETEEGANPEVDEGKPTSLYHAVKPRPKAQPISDLGKDDAFSDLQDDSAPSRARYLWAWLMAAAGLTGVLAVVGVVHPQQTESPAKSRAAGGAGRFAGHGIPATHRVNSISATQYAHDEPDVADDESTASQEPLPAPAGRPQSITFEHRNGAIVVPTRIGGPTGQVDLKMVFDTGATLTTLPPDTVRALGAKVGSATTEVETANGVVRRPLAVVESISVGNAQLTGGLTVAVCSRCGAAGTAGLLGLNFARHFVVTIDHDAATLVLRRRRAPGQQLFDIRPFVEFLEARSQRRGGRLAITFGLRNNSPRRLHDIVVVADESEMQPRPMARVASLAAGVRQEVTITGPAPQGNRTFTLKVTQARW